jgi:mannose-1-phosphate guanylyltransferase
MPIARRPLLEYWLCTLCRSEISKVLVNIHHHRCVVEEFLKQPQFEGWVCDVFEPKLLGTAGTIRQNWKALENRRILLIHADNWCQCDFSKFLDFHLYHRPQHTVMTMMTFRSESPSDCGILELDPNGVVTKLHEKVDDPPGNLANGAIYLLEPTVLDWLMQNPTVTDFSTEVLPQFFDQIATWENTGIHRDIGKISSLRLAQLDPMPKQCWPEAQSWYHGFQDNSIHSMVC